MFSTAGLPEARRIELWEGHNAAALIGLSCFTMGRGTLEATEVNVKLGDVRLARVAGSAHVVERSAGVIGRSPADAIAVYVTLRGQAWFECEGGTRTVRPGQVLLYDADQPFSRGFVHGLEELAITVPRAAFAERTGQVSFRSPVVAGFARGADPYAPNPYAPNPYAGALAMLAGRAARPERAVPADERTVLELVAVLAAGRSAEPALAHRAAARCFIEGHLADRTLTAARVAAAVGISERHLSRVFAADGTTVPRHVLSRRLALAYALLSEPVTGGTAAGSTAAGGRTVAEVAARCGFVSATYFSRAFHEHFGQHASEVRRRARG